MVPLRHNEVRLARWNEFKGRTWTVPAERMKGRKPFTMDVPEIAWEFLKKLDAGFDWQGDGYIFGVNGKPPIARQSMTVWKNRLGLKDMDIHGVRATFLTWVGDSGGDVVLGERCLDHAVDGKVRKSYMRTSLAKQRLELLTEWCEWLTEEDAPANAWDAEPDERDYA